MSTEANAEMQRMWNDVSGPKWVARQRELDAQLAPLGDAVLARVALDAGEAVLDVGAGTGALALASSDRVGPSGRVVAVDLSKVLLARARERADAILEGKGRRVDFLHADAQTTPLGEAEFDAVISRFGVMFFDDPVAAFRNLRRATKASGRLCFVCWRAPVENAWMHVPLAAASAYIPVPPPPPPGAPGPFSFAERSHVERILDSAGWREIELDAWDGSLSLGGGLSLEETVALMLDIGPTAHALREAGESARAAVTTSVRAALAPHYDERGVTLSGAAWIVHARA